MLRTVAYWFVLIVSILFVLCSIGYGIIFILLYYFYPSIISELRYAEKIPWHIVLPLATLLLTSISTLSAILLGWRLDRRQKQELELKTKDLEIKIKELELKLLSAQTSGATFPTQQGPDIR